MTNFEHITQSIDMLAVALAKAQLAVCEAFAKKLDCPVEITEDYIVGAVQERSEFLRQEVSE